MAASAAAPTTLLSLTEKYKPQSWDEMIGQTRLRDFLKMYMRPSSIDSQLTIMSSNMPHILLFGPCGTGKTTSARLMFSQLHIRTIWIESATESKIETIRKRILETASLLPSGEQTFKVFVLDEADQLSEYAQGALRDLMEQYIKVSRFCLTANDITKIIPALQSRFSGGMIAFESIKDDDMTAYLLNIIQREQMLQQTPDEVVKTIVKMIVRTADGDIRKALKLLEKVPANCSDATSMKEMITECLICPPEEMLELSIGMSTCESQTDGLQLFKQTCAQDHLRIFSWTSVLQTMYNACKEYLKQQQESILGDKKQTLVMCEFISEFVSLISQVDTANDDDQCNELGLFCLVGMLQKYRKLLHRSRFEIFFLFSHVVVHDDDVIVNNRNIAGTIFETARPLFATNSSF